jgi:hypothetical protein
MSTARTCHKCSHIHPLAQNSDTEACPQCGAIYARVEAALLAGKLRSASTSPPSSVDADSVMPSAWPTSNGRPRSPTRGRKTPFIETLRDQSHYPTVRSMLQIFTLVGYVLWGLGGGAAVIGAIMARQTMLAFGIAFLTLLMIVIIRVSKELVLMLADLSDAAVFTAAALSRSDPA